ncbi:MAG: hypothetical protein AUK48_02325 [Oscillatoriales cyanobacterium CG2_30_44_21]|nr:MAG: hypothetical protein AUK48_02325 [Oscillatoriales cyanobacterium CG2_30_44_21]
MARRIRAIENDPFLLKTMWLLTLPALFVILFVDATSAQNAPQIDLGRRGEAAPSQIGSYGATLIAQDAEFDYYRNETEIKANRKSRYGTGSLWRVKVDQLNCRQEPSLDSPIKQTYANNTVLEVQIYRGGSDEVLENLRDRLGKPWMPVRDRDSSQSQCYVRANSRYIQPVTATSKS